MIFLSWRDTTGGTEGVSPPSALLPLLSQKVACGTMLLSRWSGGVTGLVTTFPSLHLASAFTVNLLSPPYGVPYRTQLIAGTDLSPSLSREDAVLRVPFFPTLPRVLNPRIGMGKDGKRERKSKYTPITSSCGRCTGVCLSQLHSHRIKKRMEKSNRHGKEKKGRKKYPVPLHFNYWS